MVIVMKNTPCRKCSLQKEKSVTLPNRSRRSFSHVQRINKSWDLTIKFRLIVAESLAGHAHNLYNLGGAEVCPNPEPLNRHHYLTLSSWRETLEEPRCAQTLNPSTVIIT